MAVAVKEETSSAMPADELVDVPIGVTRAVPLAGVAQDHARAVFLDACAGVRLIRIWMHDHIFAPGTAPVHVAMPRPCCRFSERSPTQSVLLNPSVITDNGM